MQTIPSPAAANTARRRAFVDAALQEFMVHGYAGTTMSSIAARIGGSKTTLWSYFASKEALFEAVVDHIVEHHGDVVSINFPEQDNPIEVLRSFATLLMDNLTSEPILRLYRLVIGEAERFPHLAHLFFERGPKRGKVRLIDYLGRLMADGRLRTGDPVRAAEQFVGLCQCGVYQYALLNLPEGRNRDRLAEEIEDALIYFSRCWLTRQG